MEFFTKYLIIFMKEVLALCFEIAPFLLLGMFVSGLISVFIDKSFIFRHIGSKDFSSIFKAAMFGVPLPLCSCGVIPVASTIKDAGASKGSTVSFLISTPQTGVDSIFLTYGMLGPLFAIFRPMAALFSGILSGVVINNIDKDSHHHIATENNRGKNNLPLYDRAFSGLKYGFVTLPSDIIVPLFQGLFIAASISVFVPTDFVAQYFIGSPIIQFATMLVISIPIYVCATASIPIALAMMAKGVSPGAAFVFLMAGPATNASSIVVIKNILGKKILYYYLLLIAITSILFGLLLDLFINIDPISSTGHFHQHNADGYLKYIFLFTFMIIMINAYFSKIWISNKDNALMDSTLDDGKDHIQMKVDGMTCSHCKESVESIANNFDEIEDVLVDLVSGEVTFIGINMDESMIKDRITSIGFKVM